MERLKKLTSLLFALIVLALVTSHNVWALDTQLQAQINDLSQQEDKALALASVSELLGSDKYLGADKTHLLLFKGKLYFSLHRYNQGIDAVLQSKEIAESIEEHQLVADANKLLGVLYYYQGELQKSLRFYQASLDYFNGNLKNHKNSFAIERANLLNNIALVYTLLGQSSLALKNYQLAEPLYASYGDEADKIDVRYNIAALHINLRRFDTAIDILKVVLLKRQQLNDARGVATARASLGVAYRYSGQFELAKKNVLAALEYFRRHNYRHDIASELHNISEIYLDLDELPQVFRYAKEALVISEEVGHQKAFAGSLQTLAKAYLYSGDLVQAEQYIQRSNITAKRLDYPAVIIENLAISALIHAGNKQYGDALSAQRAYEKKYQLSANNTLNDKLAEFESEQLNQQILDLEHRRELQTLESAKIEQQRNVIILALVLVLMVTFFLYRRHLEKRITQELELRVRQRTRELEELMQELEKADQVKNQFLANMSHEIRTPLTAIVGHAEAIIHDDISQGKVKQDIEVIHGNSLHLLELINDILDLSRLEAGKFELENQPLAIGDLIQDLSQTFMAQAKKKQLDFTIVNQLPAAFTLHVDNLRLKQILFNLCSNAIKFTEKGKVTLQINKENKHLVFTVVDTGIGLSEDHIAQVFDLFTQADNSISRRFGGSGLGLALSKQLAKLMSGKITVISELGKGSSFSLTLPCQHSKSDNTAVSRVTESIGEEVGETFFKGTVLLAEDHDDNRRLIARLLSSLGLEVIVATNGIEAVELCVKHQPVLVLLDIQMPEMDGVEAFKKLRELGCHQPIYALTANAMSHEVTSYLTLGFTGHLKKPIERKNFIATIAKYFSDNTSDFNGELNKLPEKYEEALAQVDLSDLITEFKINLIKDKQNLVSYVENSDINLLAKSAHRLAGAAQMFGFTEISQAAKELELAIKSESRAGKPNLNFINDLAECLIDEIGIVEQK